MTISASRYLAILGASAAAAFALIWLWVAAMPLAYLDPEYPYWLAKTRMLASCDLGEVLVVGDSRAAADILPLALGVRATNLAVGGGEAVEAYIAVRRALACPAMPRRVVVSLDAGHFMLAELFWERSVRYGFINRSELTGILRTAAALGDRSLARPQSDDGLAEPLRSLLYTARFPSVYFSALLRGGGFLRGWRNRAALAAGLAARGQYFFGTADGSDGIAADASLPNFAPLPVQDHYFDRMLALLAARGIAVDFVAMPLNQATRARVRPEVERGYAAYLAGYAAKYPNFTVVGQVMPHWPDRFFGDGFAHMNPQGAALFSAGFGACLRARLAGARTDCEPASPTGLARLALGATRSAAPP